MTTDHKANQESEIPVSFEEALRLAAKEYAEKTDAEIPEEHTFSDRHNEKIAAVFNAAHEKSKNVHKITTRRRMRWFSAACACLAVTLCLTLSISAVREATWKSMVTWYDNHMELNREVPQDAPDLLETIYVPTYLPDGYNGADVVMESIGMYVVDYYKGDDVEAAADAGKLIGYHQMPLDGMTAVNNEHCTIEDCTVNGHPGIFITYDPDWGCARSLYWDDGSYAYSLHVEDSEISDKEILEIAESLRERDEQ